ncbi:MAG: tetratricopeptide repeat protein [Desulfovibrionaceae bacterium]
MTQTTPICSRRPSRLGWLLRLGLTAALAALLLGGCAKPAPGPETPAQWQLDREAQVTFHYLRYLDHLNRFQRMAQGVMNDPHSMGSVMEEQTQAAKALDAILEIEPSPDIYLEKANLYWNTPQIGLAREVLKEGMKRFPENRRIALYLANSFLIQNRIDDAVHVLETYLERVPGDLAARRRLARILVEGERHARAMDVLTAIPPDKRDPDVLLLMARAGGRLGKVREAIRTLERAVKIDPESIEAWAELAYLQELDKRYEAAERTYARIMSMDAPEEQLREIRLRQVQLNLKLNNPDRAMALVLETPRSESFMLEAARIFLDQDFHAQADKVLEAMVEEGPLPVEAYFYEAAIALEHDKKPRRALEILERVPEDSRHYRRSLQFRAHLLLNMGQGEEAMELIAQGKKRYPGDKDLRMLEAAYLEEQGRLEQAEAVFREILAHHPKDAEAMFQLGVLLDRMGRTADAVNMMEQVIALDPDHADALNYAGYTLAEMDRDLDRALVLVKNALKHKPGNGYIIDSLAWVYYKLGRLQQAWEEIRRAVSAEDDATIWEHYGDIARALGKKDKARQGYQRSLKLGTEQEGRVRSKLKELKP